jgi:hypothetical protein
LAQLNDEASKYAMQRYDAAKEAEREDKYRQQQLALQKKQLAAQQAANNWMQYLNTPSTSNEPTLKNWSFGNGYSVQQMPDGTAAYYKNNGKTRISAGEFLSNTGTNWKKWNDIWQNGVSTTGVGSDTISSFHRMSINPNSNEYSYLFRS